MSCRGGVLVQSLIAIKNKLHEGERCPVHDKNFAPRLGPDLDIFGQDLDIFDKTRLGMQYQKC